VPVGEVWIKSPDRRTYVRADFSPNGDIPDNVFNLWRGFGVESIPGISFLSAARKCRLMLKHIRENLCKGDRTEYRYFMRWCADMIQYPHIKSGVAISISGRKGTGKTKVAEALAGLLGHHSTTISQSRHLVGNFNYHLRQAILVVAEEAIWGGDKHADGVLKHMITSTDFAAEQKGVDVVSIKSLARIMFIGNKTWMFPADEDERRLFALTCGDKQIQNTDYFQAIDLELYGHVKGMQGNSLWRECAGIRSFMTFLSMIDLSKFNIRKIPETEGLRDQRQSSLEPHARYFQELLESRIIGFESDNQIDYITRPAEWLFGEPKAIPKRDIYENGYLVWHRKHNIKSQPIAQNAFWRWVKRVFNWSSCKVGPAGYQKTAVKVDGLKWSANNFSNAMKVDPVDLDDGEGY
jgi:energy-coupling factor transporter ATP-binding protein EcfA2